MDNQQLWLDQQSNKHYVIQNSGAQNRADPSGLPVKRFFPQATGQMNYSQRQNYADRIQRKDAQAIHPSSLSPKGFSYTPQTDKLEGYTQMPRPHSRPYQNVLEKQDRQSKLHMNQTQFNPKSLMSRFNKQLAQGIKTDWKYQNNNKGCTHLTAQVHYEQNSSLVDIKANDRYKLIQGVDEQMNDKLVSTLPNAKERPHQTTIQSTGGAPTLDSSRRSKTMEKDIFKKVGARQHRIMELRQKFYNHEPGVTCQGRVLPKPSRQVMKKIMKTPMQQTLSRSNPNFSRNQMSSSRSPTAPIAMRPGAPGNHSVIDVARGESPIVDLKTSAGAHHKRQKSDALNVSEYVQMQRTFENSPERAKVTNYALKQKYMTSHMGSFFNSYDEPLKIHRQVEVPKAPEEANSALAKGKKAGKEDPSAPQVDYKTEMETVKSISSYHTYVEDMNVKSSKERFCKTGRYFTHDLKQQKIIEDSLEWNEIHTYRAKTKGRFHVDLPNPGHQWRQDQVSKAKVNPTWKSMENKYTAMDTHLLEKRRKQRLLKNMAMEQTMKQNLKKNKVKSDFC